MPTELHASWGRRLRRLGRDREITVVELASAADISRQHVHAIESGAVVPSDVVRIRIAAALGVRVEDIFSYPAEVAS